MKENFPIFLCGTMRPLVLIALLFFTVPAEAQIINPGQNIIVSGAPVAVSASGGTCAVTTPAVGGPIAGDITVTGACATTNTITITFLTTAPNHWVCDIHDVTTAANGNNAVQIATGESTTTAVFQTNTITANDHLRFKCRAF
jgi:hypothetical protein